MEGHLIPGQYHALDLSRSLSLALPESLRNRDDHVGVISMPRDLRREGSEGILSHGIKADGRRILYFHNLSAIFVFTD